MKLTKEQSQKLRTNLKKNITKGNIPELEKILYEAIPALDHGFQGR